MEKKLFQFPFPVFIAKEGKWFVVECPVLDIATQGKTEHEAKKNIRDLIQVYLNDPDTPKYLEKINSLSLSYISVPVSQKLLYEQT